MISRPDLILCWPNNCDYPLWRKQLKEYRQRFNNIIIVFTETYSKDNYVNFVTSQLFDLHCYTIVANQILHDKDWRDEAINQALRHSYNPEWILFTEQDFYWTPEFWPELDKKYDEINFDVAAYYEGQRMHPAFILIKRQALNNTSKNFGIVKDKLDHFGVFQKDLKNSYASISSINNIINNKYFTHMAGLSHNMSLIARGEVPNWQKNEFDNYLKRCFESGEKLDPKFVEIYKKYLDL